MLLRTTKNNTVYNKEQHFQQFNCFDDISSRKKTVKLQTWKKDMPGMPKQCRSSLFFSNSLIIHQENTKEINTKTEFGYVMKHLHKIKPTFISIFSLNTDLFEMLDQTLFLVFDLLHHILCTLVGPAKRQRVIMMFSLYLTYCIIISFG